MKTTIIGLGLIGGSIALSLKNMKFATEIIGVDNNPDNAQFALDKGIVDQIYPIDKAIRDADLIIIAIPVDKTSVFLPYILSEKKYNAVVTDMGSTKYSICKSVENHPNREWFVASHPMAGTENSGPSAAFDGLFEEKTTIICEKEKSNSFAYNLIKDMYICLKMKLIEMNPQEHDMHVAYVSHISHISSFALANTVLEMEVNHENIFNLAGGGFESTVRLAKSSPEMWSPIFLQNKKFIVEAIEQYIKHLNQFLNNIKQEDVLKTKEIMIEANQIRRVLDNIKVTK
ncbi:MAG: prephenate dehydrogenase [Bacteroidetes bacterium GWE2_29_8]|nr:MAG: prephenate dehydrogenase [Bacteroidetes bacterium GWE2_29_8]